MLPTTDLPPASALVDDLRAALASVHVKARRLVLDTPGVMTTVPMLRGVWGAALHDHDPGCYAAIFEGRAESGAEAHPLYLLRPAPPDAVDWPAVEWISMGEALHHDAPLLEGWLLASARGLGPERRPFSVRAIRSLGPDGQVRAGTAGPFGLDQVVWPLGAASGGPAGLPCRLVFDVPVRMLRRGRLIDQPTLPDLVVVGLRRLCRLAGNGNGNGAAALSALNGPALAWARALPAGRWRGSPARLHRYSANQGELDLHGVTGSLDLPEGPGPLWPLLAALGWVHLGKATVFGLGQVLIQPLE
ncbi:CRISPR system precrRNA processing endoribonuclease RAMP protein Cas6 [Rhodocista pekingensis]|uniref:CRISPR system precrRNA processing endoribonuclease RAMP protein Cas6 n=1 Tax=Rhodocista pekingensis TaxID=201185 RepID=A0ABW2KTF7_9PROT